MEKRKLDSWSGAGPHLEPESLHSLLGARLHLQSPPVKHLLSCVRGTCTMGLPGAHNKLCTQPAAPASTVLCRLLKLIPSMLLPRSLPGRSPLVVPAPGPLHSPPLPPGKPFPLHGHRACHLFRFGLNTISSEKPSHPEVQSITCPCFNSLPQTPHLCIFF